MTFHIAFEPTFSHLIGTELSHLVVCYDSKIITLETCGEYHYLKMKILNANLFFYDLYFSHRMSCFFFYLGCNDINPNQTLFMTECLTLTSSPYRITTTSQFSKHQLGSMCHIHELTLSLSVATLTVTQKL